MRILIVETGWNLVALAHGLMARRIPLTRAESLEDALEHARMGQQDLIVADAGLAEWGDLASVAGGTPVALVADRYRPDEAARLLQAGAADVLDARTEQEVMVTRLLTVARRVLGEAQPEVRRGPLRLDILRRRAFLHDAPLALSPKLYETLEHLALRPGRVVSKDQLLSQVYGNEAEPSPRVFDVYVCNLRQLLAPAGGAVAIVTARAEGYRFELAEAARDAAARKTGMAA